MGLDRTVHFAPGSAPPWDAIRAHLVRAGVTPALRMIDGLPAFPDETPEPGWRELRVAVPGGMVTIRSAPDHFACVVWGNAAGDLQTGWDAVCWACAEAAGGTVGTPDGPVAAGDFARSVGLRPA
jgi:hypothetical protein